MDRLPPEVVFDIISHLDPHDVIFLGQVSQRLRALASQRSIWTTLLESMCHEHGLFLPSFAVTDMDVPELQRCVLGPWLWDTTLRKYHEKGAEEESVHVLRPLQSIPLQPRINGLTRVLLVPGGRFLLRAAPLGSGVSVTIRDLGPAGRLNILSPVIAEITLNLEHDMLATPGFDDPWIEEIACKGVDNQTLRVAIVVSHDFEDFNVFCFYILEIKPDDELARFHCVGFLQLRGRFLNTICNIEMGLDHLVILWEVEHITILWDFTKRRYISAVHGEGAPAMAHYTEGILVHVNSGMLEVWELPSIEDWSPAPNEASFIDMDLIAEGPRSWDATSIRLYEYYFPGDDIEFSHSTLSGLVQHRGSSISPTTSFTIDISLSRNQFIAPKASSTPSPHPHSQIFHHRVTIIKRPGEEVEAKMTDPVGEYTKTREEPGSYILQRSVRRSNRPRHGLLENLLHVSPVPMASSFTGDKFELRSTLVTAPTGEDRSLCGTIPFKQSVVRLMEAHISMDHVEVCYATGRVVFSWKKNGEGVGLVGDFTL